MQESYYYTIGDRQFSRDELLIFGRQHYPKFYWIKRGIGIGCLSFGLLACLLLLVVISVAGFPNDTAFVASYIAGFIFFGSFAIVGAVLFSVSFTKLPDEAYIKHAIDYYTKLYRQTQQRQTRVAQKNENKNLDQLMKYKQLLDSGAITQEEFDAKKKELL